MSVWDLSGTDQGCRLYRPGHQVHWIHFNKSVTEPGETLAVTAHVDEDGLVHIFGDDVSLVGWNHRTEALRAALERFDGMAAWKPRWHLLAVPTDSTFGSGQSVFNLATLVEKTDCR